MDGVSVVVGRGRKTAHLDELLVRKGSQDRKPTFYYLDPGGGALGLSWALLLRKYASVCAAGSALGWIFWLGVWGGLGGFGGAGGGELELACVA